MNPLLKAALAYAARGIPVYPVHWPCSTQSGASLACSCSCSRGAACDRPAKHPLLRHGVKEATTDPDRIGRWWHRWPQANVGLATGVVFDALDIDGPAGLAALRQLQEAAGPWLPGPLVATGGGGWHHWFAPTGLGNRPPQRLAHVDWRGRSGCVLAPPSRHISGRPYRWLRDLDQAPLPEVPAALRQLLDHDRPTTSGLAGPARPVDPHRPPVVDHPYGRTVLAAELAALGRATPGQRNRTLNRCAFKVYRYVAGGVLDEQDVTVAFTTVGLAIGLGRVEIGRTLASARTAGLANPRTVPAAPGVTTEEDGS
jgi:Bifunctional DNA primase/polymerase, N-terminal